MNTQLLTTSTGAIYALLAALGYALWNLYMQRALQKGAGVTGYLFALSFSLGGLFLPVAIWQYQMGSLPPLRTEGLLSFAMAGAVTGALAPFHSTQATARIGAAQTTALRLLDPFFAFVMGLLFLGEQLGASVIGGTLLIVAGLWFLQAGGNQASLADTGARVSPGMLFATGASILFTIGSALRKAGLADLPSPVLSVAIEGLAGIIALGLVMSIRRSWGEARRVFSRGHRDVWLSGLSAAVATLFLNLALQRLPLPAAVALRNTSPWFALGLAPLLLGSRHKPGRAVWLSTLLLTGGMLLILAR